MPSVTLWPPEPLSRFEEAHVNLAPRGEVVFHCKSGRRTEANCARLAARVDGQAYVIDQVRQLLGAADGPGDGCAPAAEIVEEQLRAIRSRRTELRSLETTLQAMLNRCTSICAPGGTSSCSIFEDIATAGPPQNAKGETP